MSKHLNVGKSGLALAAVVGGFHLGWSMLVALGWAQPVVDFVFWMHFFKPVYAIERLKAQEPSCSSPQRQAWVF